MKGLGRTSVLILVISLSVCLVSSGNMVIRQIEVWQNSIEIYVEGEKIIADNFVYNDTTYVPIRAVAESLGATVDWDSTGKVDIMLSKDSPTKTPEPTNSPKPEKPERISVINLIATPEKYHGKFVEVEGFIGVYGLKNISLVIFANSEARELHFSKDGILLNVVNDTDKEDIKWGGVYLISGIFDQNERSEYSGALDDARITSEVLFE